MNVEDYRKCAFKHLENCKYILDVAESRYDYGNPNERGPKTRLEVVQQYNLLIDVYYLLGYVFEGLAVYIAYKMYYNDVQDDGSVRPCSWGGDSRVKNNTDIKTHFNYAFTKNTHIAYRKEYGALIKGKISKQISYAYSHGKGDCKKQFDYYLNTKFASDYAFNKKWKQMLSIPQSLFSQWQRSTQLTKDQQELLVLKKKKDEMDSLINREEQRFDIFAASIKYAVENHSFNRNNSTLSNKTTKYPSIGFVEGYILTTLSTQILTQKSSGSMGEGSIQTIPYFGDQSVSALSADEKFLIENWSTELRYNYENDPAFNSLIKSKLQISLLKKMTETCERIFAQLLVFGF